MRPNDVRDLTAELLNVVCNDVSIEPSLTPLSGERLAYKTANLDNGARPDVAARGFWVRGQKAFADVRIFNPIAKQYSKQDLKSSHRKNEKEKKRTYNERINQIEHASFTPSGCLAKIASQFRGFWGRIYQILAIFRGFSA